MANVYYRLWEGQDILEDDPKFQSLVIPYPDIIEDVFLDREIKFEYADSIGNDARTLTCEYEEQKYLLLVTPLKNSGTEHIQYNKRAQIPHTLKLDKNQRIFVLSHYTTGDKIIYVTAEISDMLQKAQDKGVYYSLWVDYSQLKKCWEKGSCSWKDANNRVFSAITSEKMRDLSDSELIEQLFFGGSKFNINNVDETISTINNDDEPQLFDDNAYFANGMKLPRDKSLVTRALDRENYKCELCGCDITFTTDGDRQYFEGHHLIMYNYNVQKRYKYSLDFIDNIVCLCPNCHRKIHYSTNDEKENCVIKLLGKHHKLYDIYDIHESSDVQSILEDYFKGVPDDE